MGVRVSGRFGDVGSIRASRHFDKRRIGSRYRDIAAAGEIEARGHEEGAGRARGGPGGRARGGRGEGSLLILNPSA